MDPKDIDDEKLNQKGARTNPIIRKKAKKNGEQADSTGAEGAKEDGANLN